MSETNSTNVYVTNGSNTRLLSFDQLVKYIENICNRQGIHHLDAKLVASNVYPKLKKNNTLIDIDEQIVMCASEMVTVHYDYPKIAMWILIDDLHKKTKDDYLEVVKDLYNSKNKRGISSPIVNDKFYQFVQENYDAINKAIIYERDLDISLFGYRTLERAYLKKDIDGNIIERPQHMFMRVAISIHMNNNDIGRIIESYEYLSRGFFTHATPTLFNAGTRREQLSSCFLLGIEDDMYDIGECWKDCALISKYAGGIAVNVSRIRVKGAYINSTQGVSSGLRVLKVFNEIARYADQGGKRAGSIAIYIEPWHGDITFFLELKKNTGAETERARDLFLGLMINDIFMKRVENNEMWSLMCPSQCPDLIDKYGTEFTKIYENYEKQGKYLKKIPARELWFKIMESQIETGVPYIIYKDAVNYKSNQINIGVVNGSNLCTEIMEVSTSKEYSVCNLASICLPKFVKLNGSKAQFDYQHLYKVARILARNLNNIIDINYYPVEKTRVTNQRDRPIGIGVQGLADVFYLFKTPFDSDLARDINKKIFETIYFGALSESCQMAIEQGPYQTYEGSPISKGKFQFDLWNLDSKDLSKMWDWDNLRQKILKHGVRNSLVTTCMPTASTSQIMGNNECIEPYTENIYTRSTLAGNYYVVNKYLMQDLIEINMWNDKILDMIKYHEGSIQQIPGIPDDIKLIYRTVWETPQKSLIEMSADRGPFVDQSQSLNIFFDKVTFPALNSALFYGWKKGLKTGMYYLRSKPSSEANKFGIDPDKIKEIENGNKSSGVCSLFRGKNNGEACLMCSG